MPLFKHYFIRHAHRKPFNQGDWGNQVSITLEGQEASRHLGKTLAKSQISMIWTSPVKRCIQTAEEIKNGIGEELPIHSSSLLGDPGFMILNPKIAGKAFQKYQILELIDLLLKEQLVPGFCSAHLGCARALRTLINNKKSHQLWISHDLNICLLACWIFQCDQPEYMMPEFLEGIEFCFDEEDIFANYKGLKTKIDEAILSETLDSMEKPAFLKSDSNSSKVRS